MMSQHNHVRLNFSKSFADRGLTFPMEHMQEIVRKNGMVTWPVTSRDLERSRTWPHYIRAFSKSVR